MHTSTCLQVITGVLHGFADQAAEFKSSDDYKADAVYLDRGFAAWAKAQGPVSD